MAIFYLDNVQLWQKTFFDDIYIKVINSAFLTLIFKKLALHKDEDALKHIDNV